MNYDTVKQASQGERMFILEKSCPCFLAKERLRDVYISFRQLVAESCFSLSIILCNVAWRIG